MGKALDEVFQYKSFSRKVSSQQNRGIPSSSLVRSSGATHNSLPSSETALTWNSA